MKKKRKPGWIGVDLDGTLAFFDPNEDPMKIGRPIPRMVRIVKRHLAEGEEVRIFTARVDGGEVALSMGNKAGKLYRDIPKVRRKIERWSKKHIGETLAVTNRKDYGLKLFYDDRAVHVEHNTGRILG